MTVRRAGVCRGPGRGCVLSLGAVGVAGGRSQHGLPRAPQTPRARGEEAAQSFQWGRRGAWGGEPRVPGETSSRRVSSRPRFCHL